MKQALFRHKNVEFSNQLENAVREWLEGDGYIVIPLETQDSATHFMLSKENTDGSVGLFIGPVREDHAGDRSFKFQIVREMECHNEIFDVPRNTNATETADIFMSRIATRLTNVVSV